MQFSDYHLNTGPLDNGTQIYHLNTRLVWYSLVFRWLLYMDPSIPDSVLEGHSATEDEGGDLADAESCRGHAVLHHFRRCREQSLDCAKRCHLKQDRVKKSFMYSLFFLVSHLRLSQREDDTTEG